MARHAAALVALVVLTGVPAVVGRADAVRVAVAGVTTLDGFADASGTPAAVQTRAWCALEGRTSWCESFAMSRLRLQPQMTRGYGD